MMYARFRFLLPHILVTAFFVVISLAYFYPLLSGKSLVQSDIVQFKGMQRQILEHRAEFDEEPYWIDNAFMGMPTYQITSKYPYDVLRYINNALQFLPRPADMLFLYLFFFYLFAQSRRFSIPVSVFGSLVYGFSSYYIIILMVGHNTKAMALAYAPLVFIGLFQVLVDKNKYGVLWLSLGLALQLHANHVQMSYYTLIMAAVWFLIWSLNMAKKNNIKTLYRAFATLVFSGIIALLLNAQGVLATLDYTKQSTRGSSELTITPEGMSHPASDGLSFDYITEYSYGILETLTLFSPNVVGGSSGASFPMDSDFVRFLHTLDAETANTIFRYARPYWGDQPIVAAPVYLGVMVLFFALFGLVVVQRSTKIVLIAIISLSLLFSWGKHVPGLTQFFIDYLPLYGKFRAVSSAQIMIMLCVPYMAMLGLSSLIKEPVTRQKLLRLYAVLIVFVLLILFLVAGAQGFFSFTSANEPFADYPEIMNPLKDARASLLWKDIQRIVLLLVIVAAIVLLFWRKKINASSFVVLLTVFLVGDLWQQNRTYFDEEQFVSSYKLAQPFVASPQDKEILKDQTSFRVFEPRLGLSNSRTAYFHRTVGGYHGAKPAALQEVYDFYLQQEDSVVMDLLNIKYVLDSAYENGIATRPSALGAAWLVDEIIHVPTANDAIVSLGSIDPRKQAISTTLDQQYFKTSETDVIRLKTQKNNFLTYTANVQHERLAVFSEQFYANGWQAYVDGVAVPHFKVNYLLRGLIIPPGEHEVVFMFSPTIIQRGTLFMASGWVLFFLLLGLLIRKPKEIA
ncbi:MAG: YfhO family protein [Flavobacteriaceae bacterium]|nr:YfhO family protein [Flavobacteriaceae bacterium]